mmetsp:Transcript_143636/g.358011  ORF Transcript_143636/g.358011 Transcript_143636/m.358011 type:complete len:549 (+) Transcript_143636:680-2326(+)
MTLPVCVACWTALLLACMTASTHLLLTSMSLSTAGFASICIFSSCSRTSSAACNTQTEELIRLPEQGLNGDSKSPPPPPPPARGVPPPLDFSPKLSRGLRGDTPGDSSPSLISIVLDFDLSKLRVPVLDLPPLLKTCLFTLEIRSFKSSTMLGLWFRISCSKSLISLVSLVCSSCDCAVLTVASNAVLWCSEADFASNALPSSVIKSSAKTLTRAPCLSSSSSSFPAADRVGKAGIKLPLLAEGSPLVLPWARATRVWRVTPPISSKRCRARTYSRADFNASTRLLPMSPFVFRCAISSCCCDITSNSSTAKFLEGAAFILALVLRLWSPEACSSRARSLFSPLLKMSPGLLAVALTGPSWSIAPVAPGTADIACVTVTVTVRCTPPPPPPPPPSEATSPALGLPAPAPSVPTTEPRSLSPWLPMSESNWIRFRLALPWPPAALWAPLARALRKADFRASIASAVMPSWRAWMSLWNFLMKEMVRALRCSNIFFTWRVASSNSLDSLLPSSSLVFRVCSNFSPVAMALSNHSLISFVTSARSSILKLE